jgi:hypothetical protein
MKRRYSRSVIALPSLPSLPTLNKGGAGAPLSLAAQVQAILAGTAGFALDPTDASTLDQYPGGVPGTPVTTPGQPVGLINSKWGTTARQLTQITAASRPGWSGSALTFDGSDDRLFMGASDVLQNAPAAFLCARVQYDAWPGVQGYAFWVAASGAANPRFALRVDSGGQVFALRRRLNADATTFLASPGGDVIASTPCTLSADLEVAVSGAANLWKNGASIGINTLAGSGNFENVASAQVSLGSNNGPSFFVQGKIGRLVCCPFIPSAGQRATIEAWCAEVAL